jgi:hypothetical protein
MTGHVVSNRVTNRGAAISVTSPASLLIILWTLTYLSVYDVCTWYAKGSAPRVLLNICILSRRRSKTSQAQLVRAVEIACALYVKRITCLHRSTALACVLRRYGFEATVVVGFRQPPFQSHAWVEIDEAVVGDHATYRRHFQVIDVMPARKA